MQPRASRLQPPAPPPAVPAALAGVIAGVLAGLAYLAAQAAFAATVLGGSAADPLLRTSAILLGPDAAPGTGMLDLTTGGLGFLVHLALAMVFGRMVEWWVRGDGLVRAVLKGASIGTALFVLNFWLVAPLAFPWFVESRHLFTAMDHGLFGAVAGACCQLLTGRRD